MDNPSFWRDLKDFFLCLVRYSKSKTLKFFHFFEGLKSKVAARLYWQRGRYARPFVHSGMALLIFGGLTIGPILISETFPGLTDNPWQNALPPSAVLSAAIETEMETATLVSIKPRAENIEYEVKTGDTVSGIAEKFGVSIDTIRWANNLESIKSIKPGQKLKILPVTGIRHKVKHGETVYSIAKKYSVEAQNMVNWPYNSFANDETFALAVGQELIVPDGVMPKVQLWAPQQYRAYQAPVGGTVAGTGQFVWPAGGRMTQGFVWYHRAIDIANKAAPNIVAADRGTVVATGWLGGYGNQVKIDHANGFSTLYAHFSSLNVSVGQQVSQGQVLGRMGCTGRCTGTHLHFEIRLNGTPQNPMNYLR
ncbi:peptidoglycan DD-metalloendopeptidase family protein [Patescibacteria group bacterium]